MDSTPPEDFGELITYLRLLKNVPTMKELAFKAGIDEGSLSLIEKGKTKTPQSDTRKRIYKVLKLNEEERKLAEDAYNRNLVNRSKGLVTKKRISQSAIPLSNTDTENKNESGQNEDSPTTINLELNTLSPKIDSANTIDEQVNHNPPYLDTMREVGKKPDFNINKFPFIKGKPKVTIAVVILFLLVISIVVFGTNMYYDYFDTSQKPLYSADWSKGMDGWTINTPKEWSVSSGYFENSAYASGFYSLLAFPPYKTSKPSGYAIEASIKILQLDGDFGFFFRGNSNEEGYKAGIQTGVGSHAYLAISCYTGCGELGRSKYPIDFTWHTYRLEVKGNYYRLYAGSQLIHSQIDGTITNGNIIGLYSDHVRIAVRSFKVFNLS